MFDIILNMILSLVDTYIFFLFLNLFMRQRFYKSKMAIIYSFFIIVIIHTISSYLFNSNIAQIKIIIFGLLDVFFCIYLFDDRWYKYILSIFLFYMLMAISELFIITILNYIIDDYNAVNLENPYTIISITTVATTRLIEFLIIQLIKIYKNKSMRTYQWIGLSFLPILTFIFIWLVYPYYWSLNDKNIKNLLLILTAFLVLQNLFVFIYIAIIQSSTERYFIMKEAYDRQKQYSSTISSIQKAVRKMAHDIRHHFIYLRSALDQEDIPKAKSYLNQLDENLEYLIPLNVTGHYDVDALLHAKASIAEKLNIYIRVEGTLPPELMISPIDLSALLGNSIDNAIESASRLNGEKEITIAFYYNAARLSYTISNPYNGQLQRKPDGYFVSQKGSGLGFEIMDEVVKKYGGALLTENNDDTFKLTVMLQTPQS